MTLSTGMKLGPYEIVSPLGAGGMGEVYRARDSRLDRDVAIKVLPEAMARDPERVARFEREAKLLASLNHPNIALIHGFEEANGTRFLVLEYVEGGSLSQRLKKGALPVEETLEIGRQVAVALESAHEHGVIHRDLKPGNVMVKPDETVKVLDFGLAKAMSDEPSGTALANSPTITAHYTKPGVVLGTAAYMSPEQARGRAVDARTDIWSFGVLIFECLTGESPFLGESATDSIGAILHKDIELSRLPESTPHAIRQLLRRCLQRDKHRRVQSAGDARIELEETIQQLDSGAIDVGNQPRGKKRAWVWPVTVALLAVLLGISLLQRQQPGELLNASLSDSAPVVTELVQLTNLPGMQTDPFISPDGRMLLFVARDGLDLDIFLQRVGGENAINLTADSPFDDYDPAFSPNGDRIAFRSQREGGGLFVMGATGESPRRVSAEGFAPAWSPDGMQLVYTTEDVEGPYIRSTVAKLWILDLASRQRRLLTDHDAVGPVYAPNGKFVAFWAAIAGVRDIFVIPVGGGPPQPVTQDTATDWNPLWSPDGRTLYFISDRSGSPDLWRIPVDLDTGKVIGGMRPVTAGVTRIDQATITSDGKVISFMAPLLMSSIEKCPFDPQLGQITGKKETAYASTSVLIQFDVSPDGKRLTFRTGAPREDLVVMNLDGTGRRRLMDDTYRDRGPRWTPDGQWIMFYSNRGGFYDEWRIRPNGTDVHRLTATTGDDVTFLVPSPGGNLLAGSVSSGSGQSLILFELDRPISEINTPLSVPDGTLLDFSPLRFSPDARWLAGSSSYMVAVYDLKDKSLIAVHAPDGGELLVSQDGGLDWIDENRLLTWDEKRDKAFICDVKTGNTKVLEGLEGPCDIRVIEGGHALVVNRLRKESDIWMLRLGRINDSSDGLPPDSPSTTAAATSQKKQK